MDRPRSRWAWVGALAMIVVNAYIILNLIVFYVFPRVIGHSAQANRAMASADIAELRNAVNRFRIDCDRMPTHAEGLPSLLKCKARGWHGPSMVHDLQDDPWGNPYVYRDLGNDQFVVVSYGSDGKPGGEAGTEAEDVGDVTW